MSTYFANNKPFLWLNKNYASYDNQIRCNEFGIFCCTIIMQFHNFTNTVTRSTLAKHSLTSPIIRPCNACKLAVIDILGKRSHIEIVSKIMKLCDYYAVKRS